MEKQIFVIDNDIVSFIPIEPDSFDVDYVLAYTAFEEHIKKNPEWLKNEQMDTYVHITSSNFATEIINIEKTLNEKLPDFSFSDLIDKLLNNEVAFNTSHIDNMDSININHDFCSYHIVAKIELEKYTLQFEVYTPEKYEPYIENEVNLSEFITPILTYYAQKQKDDIMNSTSQNSLKSSVIKVKI